MKIIMVCYPTHGGSGVVATELGKELAELGHTVHFVSYQLPLRLDRFQAGVYYHEVDMPVYPLFKYPPYTLALINQLAELLDRERPDIIHAHYAIPHTLCAHIAREIVGDRHVRVVTTLHGTDITLVGSDPSFKRITGFSLEKSDAVTAVSDNLAVETGEYFAPSREVRTIYNFINTRRFFRQPQARERICRLPAGGKVLLHVSNFRPVKRIPDVIEVFSRVRREIDAKLLLVGDGPQRTEAQRMAEHLGLSREVLFLGLQDNVLPLFSAADLFLLPSEKESFGLGALEAMACRVPVVATNTGGLPEVVKHGETGFLAAVGDIAALAGHALEVLGDESRLRRMGEAARSRAENVFDSRLIVPKYEQLYLESVRSAH